MQWVAQARHCVHSAPEEPVELEGQVVVRDSTPGGALAAAKKHALGQLPQGEDWSREAAVSVTVDDVTLTSGRVWPIRGGDAPL